MLREKFQQLQTNLHSKAIAHIRDELLTSKAAVVFDGVGVGFDKERLEFFHLGGSKEEGGIGGAVFGSERFDRVEISGVGDNLLFVNKSSFQI